MKRKDFFSFNPILTLKPSLIAPVGGANVMIAVARSLRHPHQIHPLHVPVICIPITDASLNAHLLLLVDVTPVVRTIYLPPRTLDDLVVEAMAVQLVGLVIEQFIIASG